ncbi:MAG: helix-turn-helix transcriptional regulator [Vicinamibacterales bacterium]
MRTPSTAPALTRYISPRALMDATGLSEATLWRLRRRGELPEPVRLSPGRVAWPEDVITRWLEGRAGGR